MPLVNAGRNLISAMLVGEAVDPFDASNAYLGVGDSSTAYAAGQTDLQAASNKLRKGMEATYPSRATNVLSFRSLFGTGDANWHWQEWALFNAAAAGDMLSRKVEDLGTKTSAQSWLLTVDITVSIGA